MNCNRQVDERSPNWGYAVTTERSSNEAKSAISAVTPHLKFMTSLMIWIANTPLVSHRVVKLKGGSLVTLE